MRRWTLFVLRHRGLVLGVWTVAVIVAVAAAAQLAGLLTNHFTLPGTDSERAEKILESGFHQSTVGTFTLVGESAAPAAQLLPTIDAAAKRATSLLPTGRHEGTVALNDHVVSARIVSTLTAAEAKQHVQAMRAAIGPSPGAQVFLTGFPAVEHDVDSVLQDDLRKGELFVALPVAVLMLLWTFGTLSFVLPLALAAVAITVTLGAVAGIAHAVQLTSYVVNLVVLVGLGVAIDYSLLIVHRFREEAAVAGTTDDAIVRTMTSAGRAVLFSGIAVAVGLALLLFLPLPFLRGFGIGGLLIPLVSVAAAVSLLPAMLSLCGAALEQVRLVPGRWLARRDDVAHGFWPRLAGAIMKRPLVVALSTSALLLLMAAPMLGVNLGPGSNEGLPGSLDSIKGLRLLSAAVGAGATAPTSIVVDAGDVQAATDPKVLDALDRLVAGLDTDPQSAFVFFDATSALSIDRSGRYALVQVVGKGDFGDRSSMAFVDRLRDRLIPAAAFPPQVHVFAGGAPAAGRDFLRLVRKSFPWLVLAMLAVTYALLTPAFHSLLLPLKAIVLNLMSIGAAYGLCIAAFNWGWGAPLGLIAHAQVDVWIPVVVFAILFGLSMDYEVFLVSRMREAWDAGATNEAAVATGLAKTGRLVTAAGLIMCAAFLGFVAGSIVELQQFGFALAAAVFIDVSLVRALLLPATMALFGRANWYLPARFPRSTRRSPP